MDQSDACDSQTESASFLITARAQGPAEGEGAALPPV